MQKAILITTLLFISCNPLTKWQNEPPQISHITANPERVDVCGQTTLYCLADDPDKDELSYSWSASGGTITANGAIAVWDAPNSAGSYTITCKVDDGNDGKDKSSITITYEPLNQAPVISSLTTVPEVVNVCSTATIICVAADPDGDVLSYAWEVTGGSLDGNGATVAWTAPSLPGTYTITSIVDDGGCKQAEKSVSIIYTPSSLPPIIMNLSAAADSVMIDSSTTITCLASDPDGDVLTYTWEASAGVISGSGAVVTWTAPDSPDLYSINCIVDDGNCGQDTTTINLFHKNQTPIISSLNAAADSVEICESTTLTCTATDPEGDNLTYLWTASGGTIVGNGNGVSYNAPNLTGSFLITCTVDDGNGGWDIGNNTIIVVDTSTVAGTITLSVVFDNASKELLSTMYGVLWKGYNWTNTGDYIYTWQIEETFNTSLVNGTYQFIFDEQYCPKNLGWDTYWVGVEEWIPNGGAIARSYYNADSLNTTSLIIPSGILIDAANQSYSIEIHIND